MGFANLYAIISTRRGQMRIYAAVHVATKHTAGPVSLAKGIASGRFSPSVITLGFLDVDLWLTHFSEK